MPFFSTDQPARYFVIALTDYIFVSNLKPSLTAGQCELDSILSVCSSNNLWQSRSVKQSSRVKAVCRLQR